MRAYDIALFLIILQAAIGFTNELGIFDEQYYATQNNTYTNYRVSDLDEFNNLATEEAGLWDYTTMLANLAWEGIKMFLSVIFSIVIIFPKLISIFNIPAGISAFIQVAIYVVYFIGWAQWKSNKGMRMYE